jgi:hypothetical protein
MKPRYRAIPINDGSADNTGQNWNECAPEAAQCWAVEDRDESQPWLVDTYDTQAEAEAEAATLNGEQS